MNRKSPLFIVGAQRSGTTMLRLMLDTHSRIAIPFETDFILPYYSRQKEWDLTRIEGIRELLKDILQNPFIQRGEMSDLTLDQIVPHVEDYSYAGVVDAVFSAWAISRNKTRWGDKNPGVPQIHLLNEMFPDAMFLHIIRDGRDVAASRMHIKTWTQKSVHALAHHWCWNVSFVRQMGRLLGARYKEIQYEALVRTPERVLQDVCAWLDEAYEPGMLDFHTSASERMPADLTKDEHRTSVSPLDPTKIGMSRRMMPRGDRAIFQTIAHKLLDDLGYELEDERTLGFRLTRKVAEVRSAVRGLSVFEFPGADYLR